MNHAMATSYSDNSSSTVIWSRTPLFLIFTDEKGVEKKFTLSKESYSFGRADTNDLVMNHGSISRKHGTIAYQKEGGVLISDNGSSNGLRFKGKSVSQLFLNVGETVQIGDVSLRLEATEDSPRTRLYSVSDNDAQQTMVLPVAARSPSPLYLLVTDGPDKDAKYSLHEGRSTYGRDPENNIVVKDKACSRKHGVIEYKGGDTVIFYDLASANGIAKSHTTGPVLEIKIGETLQVGQNTFKVIKNTTGKKSSAKKIKLSIIVLLLPITLAVCWYLVSQHTIVEKNPVVNETTTTTTTQETSPTEVAPTPSEPIINTTNPAPEVLPATIEQQPAVPHQLSKNSAPHNSVVVRERSIQNNAPRLAEKITTRSKQMMDENASANANEAFLSGDYPQAFSLWQNVISADPNNAEAREGLARLEKLARRYLEQGMMMMVDSKDQAVSLLKKVTTITVDNSPVHQNALKLLNQLGAI